MKVVAYLYSNKDNEDLRNRDIQSQKLSIVDYCKANQFSLSECIIEDISIEDTKFPRLVELIAAEDIKYTKIIIYSKQIFEDTDDFKNWLFDELKARKINIDFVFQSDEDKKEANIEEKENILREQVVTVSSLPAILAKMLQLIQSDTSSASQLAKVIQYDLGLTTKILKLVNSPFFGFPKQISSIQHSIAILGFNTIKGLVLSSGICSSFRRTGSDGLFDYEKFWLYATLTATIATDLANKNGNYAGKDKEEVFAAAVLHDIGRLILNQYDSSNYYKVLANKPSLMDYKKLLMLEEYYCVVNHTHVGKLITESWNLPDSISSVTKFHHAPLDAPSEFQKLVVLIYVSSILSNLILNDMDLEEKYFDLSILDKFNFSYTVISNKFNQFLENPQKIEHLKKFFK